MRFALLGLVLSGCALPASQSQSHPRARAAIDHSQDAVSRDATSSRSAALRAPREPLFAEALFRPSDMPQGHAAPREWIHERPELDEAWPRGSCEAGRETWMNRGDTTSIVRTVRCPRGARDLRSTHPTMESLLRAVAARVDAHNADAGAARSQYGITERFESSALHIAVTEQRWCIAHACSSVSDPGVEIAIITMRNPQSWFEHAYARSFSLMRATRGLEAVAFGPTGQRMYVEYQPRVRNGREVMIVFALQPTSQANMRRWLIDHRFATVSPMADWQLDATRAELSFITMPPGHPEGVGEIHGIAREDEPFEIVASP